MANLKVLTKLGRTFSRVGLRLKKHSPEILMVGGVIGVVGSTVMACKATTKLNGVLEESKKNVAKVHEDAANRVTEENVEQVEKELKKDLTVAYAKTGVELVKLYAPSVILGTLSIASIVSSHGIMRKRNVALAAAYTAVDKGFKEYRGRVVERFGKNLDRELRYNLKAKEIEETIIDEQGKEKTVKSTVEVMDETYTPSEFAFFFDEFSTNWDKDAEMNRFFLMQQQDFANEKLKERGHLFLNEVLDMLGKDRTKAGSQVGWIYDEDNPHIHNYVDFGIFVQTGNEKYDEPKRAFVDGKERSILIDPNVDGVIYDLLP